MADLPGLAGRGPSSHTRTHTGPVLALLLLVVDTFLRQEALGSLKFPPPVCPSCPSVASLVPSAPIPLAVPQESQSFNSRRLQPPVTPSDTQ